MIGKIILLMVGVFGAGMACGNILVDRIVLPEQEDVLRGQNFRLGCSVDRRQNQILQQILPPYRDRSKKVHLRWRIATLS